MATHRAPAYDADADTAVDGDTLVFNGTTWDLVAAGGGKLTLVESIAVTSAVATWDNVETLEDDKQYLLVLRHVDMSEDAYFRLQVYEATVLITAGYEHANQSHTATGTGVSGSGSADSIHMMRSANPMEGVATQQGLIGKWVFGKYTAGDYFMLRGESTYYNTSADVLGNHTAGSYGGGTGTVTGIRLLTSAGNFSAIRGEIYEVSQ